MSGTSLVLLEKPTEFDASLLVRSLIAQQERIPITGKRNTRNSPNNHKAKHRYFTASVWIISCTKDSIDRIAIKKQHRLVYLPKPKSGENETLYTVSVCSQNESPFSAKTLVFSHEHS